MSQACAPITQCKVCGSHDLTWFTSNLNRSDVQQGRLRTGDVECVYFLGCDACSETLAMVPAEQLTDLLNSKALQVRRDGRQRVVELSDHVLTVVWSTVATVAHNQVVRLSNDRIDQGCSQEVSDTFAEAFNSIKPWLKPDAEYLAELREVIAKAASAEPCEDEGQAAEQPVSAGAA